LEWGHCLCTYPARKRGREGQGERKYKLGESSSERRKKKGFSRIFRKGWRLIERHTLDFTNMWDYYENHGCWPLDYVHVYAAYKLWRGGGTFPSWPYVKKPYMYIKVYNCSQWMLSWDSVIWHPGLEPSSLSGTLGCKTGMGPLPRGWIHTPTGMKKLMKVISATLYALVQRASHRYKYNHIYNVHVHVRVPICAHTEFHDAVLSLLRNEHHHKFLALLPVGCPARAKCSTHFINRNVLVHCTCTCTHTHTILDTRNHICKYDTNVHCVRTCTENEIHVHVAQCTHTCNHVIPKN
jgi:hypothetical protein